MSDDWNPAAIEKVKLAMKSSCSVFFVQHKELNLHQTTGDLYFAQTCTAEPVSLRESLVQSQLAVFRPELYETGNFLNHTPQAFV